MPRVDILKQVKAGTRRRLVAIPRDAHGRDDWKALPEGRCFIEWHEGGKRKRQAAAVTAADVLEAARRQKHKLEARAFGFRGFEIQTEEAARVPLHVAAKRYLKVGESLKKPNTLRKCKAVLNRFLEFFSDRTTARSISPDDLNQFMVHLKRKYQLGNNTLIHNMIIVAQFLKKQGRAGLTGVVDLPEAAS
jgi:hypothetical protein